MLYPMALITIKKISYVTTKNLINTFGNKYEIIKPLIW